jgi:hypothetical protein
MVPDRTVDDLRHFLHVQATSASGRAFQHLAALDAQIRSLRPRRVGVDPRRGHLRFGRTLPRLLRDAALTGVTDAARIPLAGPDTARLQRTLVLRRSSRLLAAGLLTGAEIDQHLADIANGDLDLAAFPVVSAWGRTASQPQQYATEA